MGPVEISNFCNNHFHFTLIQDKFVILLQTRSLDLNLSGLILKLGNQNCPLSYLDLCNGKLVGVVSSDS